MLQSAPLFVIIMSEKDFPNPKPLEFRCLALLCHKGERFCENDVIRISFKIVINDNVDSDKGMDDFTPLRNIINEWAGKRIQQVDIHLNFIGNFELPLSEMPKEGPQKLQAQEVASCAVI